jgi:hypothetical protein
MTGAMNKTMHTATRAACVAKTVAIPSFAIQLGWKYPTANPPHVRHMLMMALTTEACSGYFSSAKAVALLKGMLVNEAFELGWEEGLTPWFQPTQY